MQRRSTLPNAPPNPYYQEQFVYTDLVNRLLSLKRTRETDKFLRSVKSDVEIKKVVFPPKLLLGAIKSPRALTKPLTDRTCRKT